MGSEVGQSLLEIRELCTSRQNCASNLTEMTVDLNDPSLQPEASSSAEPNQAPRQRRRERKKPSALTEEQLKSRSSGGSVSGGGTRRKLANERVELDLLSTRLSVNGVTNTMDIDPGDGEGVFRVKYERAVADLEFAKRRLLEQHEEDLEQTMVLKKQMEKKLNEAYEEVDEQKRDVASWKKKTQKANSEINDTRVLLDEQNEKSELLERKFRKVDAEL